MTRRRSWSL